MTAPPPPILETDRLVLRPLFEADAGFVLRLLNEPSFLKHIGDKGVRTREDAVAYIHDGPMRSYARFGFGLYLVALRATNRPIGLCGLLRREALEDVDVGFAFLPDARGKGYAFESAAAVLAYGRASLGLTRIVAIAAPENDASIRLLQKLGFAFERQICLPGDEKAVALYGSHG
jgi:RimJ/RimL family protein N-acetyltransferase